MPSRSIWVLRRCTRWRYSVVSKAGMAFSVASGGNGGGMPGQRQRRVARQCSAAVDAFLYRGTGESIVWSP